MNNIAGTPTHKNDSVETIPYFDSNPIPSTNKKQMYRRQPTKAEPLPESLVLLGGTSIYTPQNNEFRHKKPAPEYPTAGPGIGVLFRISFVAQSLAAFCVTHTRHPTDNLSSGGHINCRRCNTPVNGF